MTRKIDRACSKRTICEVHRQAYDIISVKIKDPNVREELRTLIEEAFGMGVKLVQRLIDHKIEMLEWDKCSNRNEVNALRKERLRLDESTFG